MFVKFKMFILSINKLQLKITKHSQTILSYLNKYLDLYLLLILFIKIFNKEVLKTSLLEVDLFFLKYTDFLKLMFI